MSKTATLLSQTNDQYTNLVCRKKVLTYIGFENVLAQTSLLLDLGGRPSDPLPSLTSTSEGAATKDRTSPLGID